MNTSMDENTTGTCTVCGAWVYDSKLHDEWHHEQTELLLTLTKQTLLSMVQNHVSKGH